MKLQRPNPEQLPTSEWLAEKYLSNIFKTVSSGLRKHLMIYPETLNDFDSKPDQTTWKQPGLQGFVSNGSGFDEAEAAEAEALAALSIKNVSKHNKNLNDKKIKPKTGEGSINSTMSSIATMPFDTYANNIGKLVKVYDLKISFNNIMAQLNPIFILRDRYEFDPSVLERLQTFLEEKQDVFGEAELFRKKGAIRDSANKAVREKLTQAREPQEHVIPPNEENSPSAPATPSTPNTTSAPATKSTPNTTSAPATKRTPNTTSAPATNSTPNPPLAPACSGPNCPGKLVQERITENVKFYPLVLKASIPKRKGKSSIEPLIIPLAWSPHKTNDGVRVLSYKEHFRNNTGIGLSETGSEKGG